MSVISNFTVTPNRIEVITRYLASLGEQGISLTELRARLSPATLRGSAGEGEETGGSGRGTVSEAITETVRLGFAESFDRDGVSWLRFIADSANPSGSLLERLERILLDAESAAAHKHSEFRRALAWLLTQDPLQPIDTGKNISSLIQEQCPSERDVFELTSTSRAQNFYYWVRYLGYGWHLSVDNSSPMFTPDPTSALMRRLPLMMTPGQMWPLAQFVTTWAERSPVVEGGAARNEIEKLLLPALRREPGMFSRSTSLALHRLEQRGVIHLLQKSDAAMVLLDVGSDPRPISHLTYLV